MVCACDICKCTCSFEGHENQLVKLKTKFALMRHKKKQRKVNGGNGKDLGYVLGGAIAEGIKRHQFMLQEADDLRCAQERTPRHAANGMLLNGGSSSSLPPPSFTSPPASHGPGLRRGASAKDEVFEHASRFILERGLDEEQQRAAQKAIGTPSTTLTVDSDTFALGGFHAGSGGRVDRRSHANRLSNAGDRPSASGSTSEMAIAIADSSDDDQENKTQQGSLCMAGVNCPHTCLQCGITVCGWDDFDIALHRSVCGQPPAPSLSSSTSQLQMTTHQMMVALHDLGRRIKMHLRDRANTTRAFGVRQEREPV